MEDLDVVLLRGLGPDGKCADLGNFFLTTVKSLFGLRLGGFS